MLVDASLAKMLKVDHQLKMDSQQISRLDDDLLRLNGMIIGGQRS